MTLLESPRDTRSPKQAVEWLDVCAFDDLTADRGACALVDGVAVAIFRCWPDDELYAIGNVDPFSKASVLSRGIVGSIGDRPVVASPIFKNRFDLRSGASLDDESISVPTYAIELRDGRVRVATQSSIRA